MLQVAQASEKKSYIRHKSRHTHEGCPRNERVGSSQRGIRLNNAVAEAQDKNVPVQNPHTTLYTTGNQGSESGTMSQLTQSLARIVSSDKKTILKGAKSAVTII